MGGSALANQRSTRQRRELLTLFQACEDFVSARSLHAAAEAAGIMIGLTTVYRTLRILEADGGADVIREASCRSFSSRTVSASPTTSPR